jgi:nitroreductase
MELTCAVRTRRSEHNLVSPAPSNDEFVRLLECAATAPDHGRLRPWRWILVRGHGRLTLGNSLAAHCQDEKRDRAAALALRAPLLATLVFVPKLGHKIPLWEQLAATTCVTNSLMLLLHDQGYGSLWKTGPHVQSAATRIVLDLDRAEVLLGWLYVGTPDPTKPLAPRAIIPVADKVTMLDPVRSVHRTQRVGQSRTLAGCL